MNDAPNGLTPNLIGGAIRWLKHRFTDQETELAFLFGLRRKTYSRIVRDRRIRMAVENLAVRTKSQSDLAGNQGNCLYRS